MPTKFSKMIHNVRCMTVKGMNLKIRLLKAEVAVKKQEIQIKIRIIMLNKAKNVLIKMIIISMVISKQERTILDITQDLIRVKISFGKRLRGSKNRVKKNTRRKKMSGRRSRIANKLTTQMKSGMVATRNKKKNITNNIMKVTCMDGARIISNHLPVHQIPTINDTTILIQCSTEPSFTERGYSQRKRKITVSTHPRKILTSIKIIAVRMQGLICLVINIWDGFICMLTTLLKSVITKISTKLEVKIHCSNQPKLGLILKQLKV